MTVTTEFLAATVTSHTAVRRAEVWSPGGSLLTTLPVTGGNVSGTYGQAVRWTCDVTVPARPDLVPRNVGDLLHPLTGNELRLFAGVRHSRGGSTDGTEEEVPWGAYPIVSATPTRGGDTVSFSVAGSDRSEYVSSQGFVEPYQTLSGDAADAVADLLENRCPTLAHDLDDLTGTVNAQVLEGSGGSDPWRDARALVADVGHDLAVDLDGVVRARPVPDPAGASPVRTYGPNDLRVLTKIDRPMTRDGVHTGVVVWAQNPTNGAVFYAVRWDENPASPTFCDGPLGRRPRWVDSSRIGSQATADQAAEAELRRLRGRGDGYRVSLPIDPSLDVGSIVAVQFDTDSPTETCFVEQVTFPWEVGAEMQMTLRTTAPQVETS